MGQQEKPLERAREDPETADGSKPAGTNVTGNEVSGYESRKIK